MSRYTRLILGLLMAATCCAAARAEVHRVLIRDVATVEGVRDNSLIGYGLVVGLKGTGDRQQTYFTVQTLASILARMGVQIPTASVRVNNVAAVFVTASLPPFSRPGMHLDVMVSSSGDARSLEGGLLLLTPLYAADGQVFAAAQGPLVVGGYTTGTATNSRQMNHPTVGRVPGGALVERDSALNLAGLDRLSLLLNDANFSTAEDVASVINREWSTSVAKVVDSRRIEIELSVPCSLAWRISKSRYSAGPKSSSTSAPELSSLARTFTWAPLPSFMETFPLRFRPLFQCHSQMLSLQDRRKWCRRRK
jgi:flagellar P-ring protein precursor FlgI